MKFLRHLLQRNALSCILLQATVSRLRSPACCESPLTAPPWRWPRAFFWHPSPSPAGPGARPGDPRMSQQPKPAEEPRLVCEHVEQMGSHFRRKVCATPEAWEARRRRDAAQLERMGDQGAGCGGVTNPC